MNGGYTLLLPLLSLLAAASVRGQLMDVSFETGTRFRQDYVYTDFYFPFQEGRASFHLHFDPTRPDADDDFVRIRVTEHDGTPVFNEHRALQSVSRTDEFYRLAFTVTMYEGPRDRHYYENFEFYLTLLPGGVDERGGFLSPEVTIHFDSLLYAYAWSPFIQYVPPGHGGEFRFDAETTHVTGRFVPVPEPSTYGLAAVGMLGAILVWRQRRRLPAGLLRWAS